ncbi:mechanosensitive ion channel family protein [Candidatus Nitronereus thalassa]|uniref:Mechanosensitive ion channel n=1 Tax=Candidatus Nitronereus thalassa TaxID=3020898 RepID=A0ABU3K7B8_9BACT|nr:mechanosensitive ion channel domain-containing protein [Candidatus Nitronereus thalassa]MDT7042281.1 mechanosensitive ion channel [Candidatus Nitronereus thalassa]
MDSSLEQITEQGVGLLIYYGMSLLGAIVIFILGRMLAGWAQNTTKKFLERTGKIDQTICDFLSNCARYVILIFTFIMVLSQFGVETTSLIAIFGAAGLAIGLALQGTLSNVAAGVMLLIFRPFKVGDYVEAAGVAGTVKSITLFVTELATPDNVQILSPNASVWGATVKNYSHHSTRRVDFVVGIDYSDNIDKAMETLHAAINADARVLKDPAPMVVVGNLGDNSVDLTVRVWCNAGDYWGLKFDLTKAFKEKLDAAGISIPFPQRTVHLVKAEG